MDVVKKDNTGGTGSIRRLIKCSAAFGGENGENLPSSCDCDNTCQLSLFLFSFSFFFLLQKKHFIQTDENGKQC
jgi:hypothetical protein